MSQDEDPSADIALISSRAIIRKIIFAGEKANMTRNINDIVEEKRQILEDYVNTRISVADFKRQQELNSCSGCKNITDRGQCNEACDMCRRLQRSDNYEKYDLETDFASRCALSLANSPSGDRVSIIKDMLISYKAEL